MTIKAIGLMSGTSADGVSAVAAKIARRGQIRILAFETLSYPRSLRHRILNAFDARTSQISCLNAELGEFFSRVALRLIKQVGPVDLIGSHGQTIFHDPGRHTLQIAEPAIIAERTGVTTVADFRPRDIAAGGQGAPLVPYFDQWMFGDRVRALQNIGGIANVTVTGPRPFAFDTGPGNCLIDEACRRLGLGDCDRNGDIALSGRLDLPFLAHLMKHPYLRKRPPKSTGRELFHWRLVSGKRRPEDLVATVTAFTAWSIGDQYRRFVLPRAKVREVIVSGGGVYNRTLMDHLCSALFPLPVRRIDEFGIHPLAKEPLAFAVLACETIRGISGNVPSATGARRKAVLGKILPGRNFHRFGARRM